MASFDLPNHGERANRFGAGFPGMAKEVASGNDVFADIRETGRTFIDYAIKNYLVAGGAIVLNGTSRGGLAVLHLMAGDERVIAGAINVPVTYLPALVEFRELADNEIIRRSNAESLVKELADRAIFITMGETDARVSAENCFRFYAKFCAASKKTQPVFFLWAVKPT